MSYAEDSDYSYLGTGKTVMTLALILATIDQLPSPEEEPLDPRHVLTPVALRHFPGKAFADARNKLKKRTSSKKAESRDAACIPSLTEYVLHLCRTNPSGTGMRGNEDVLKERGLWKAYKQCTPFYHHYEEDNGLGHRPSRRDRGGTGPPKTIFISHATLVVVPVNLMHQWSNEMNKHCESSLRRYVATNEPLPPARKLALYDVSLYQLRRMSFINLYYRSY